MTADSYNATGHIRTLVGNWQEELAPNGGTLGSSVLAAPTFERVINHTDRLASAAAVVEPAAWKPHSADSFQSPASRIDLLSYPKILGCGPRQAQELQQLRQQAAAQAPPQAPEPSWETTHQAESQAKDMEGLQCGCKVMQPDGTPAQRDPVFLQETGLMPSAARIMARQAASAPAQGIPLAKAPSLGYVHPPSAEAADRGSGCARVSGLTSSSVDPAVPITMYTEAAAKMTYNSTFYGTAMLGKGLMSRNDQFTKLMGDVNKNQRLL